MPEPSNDRLEEFFRKAASRPDVTFNDDDWKKLEARLDAADAGNPPPSGRRIKTTAIIVGALAIIFTTLWIGATFDIFTSGGHASVKRSESPATAHSAIDALNGNKSPTGNTAAENIDKVQPGPPEDVIAKRRIGVPEDQEAPSQVAAAFDQTAKTDPVAQSPEAGPGGNARRISISGLPLPLPAEKIDRELIRSFPVSTERYKQKAVVELPGAEEEKTREADAIVEKELASDQTKFVAAPRLSLLLSFAPDFSGTSMNRYSAPGWAFGAMAHYHLLNRWSISAGVIKNQKQYTGDGEDYKPPQNYWKYYTNGVIPETIDGSCSILEFPLMIQYTLHNQGKNKWLIGGGTSSYLMQTESYVYNFSQPNPGAKERWDSRGSSRFFFNMINFTIAYERQVLPGLMLGVEPYAKIPVEEIGWTNLRLFSTGASVTLRYTVLRKGRLSFPQRSRAPD